MAVRHNTLDAITEGLTTADATVTTLAYFSTVPNRGYIFTAEVVALNQDLSQAAAYVRVGAFRTNAAGVLTQVGSTTAVATIEDNAAWDLALAVSQTDSSGAAKPEIRVNVTGAAATNVNWRADIHINRVGSATTLNP